MNIIFCVYVYAVLVVIVCLFVVVFLFFLVFDFCRFCVIIRFFHPRLKGQWPPTSKDFYTRSYPLHLFSYLSSWERASIFPFQCWVLNKGNYWYHFYNVFGMVIVVKVRLYYITFSTMFVLYIYRVWAGGLISLK